MSAAASACAASSIPRIFSSRSPRAHVGRPVKWIEDRREHLLATNHARETECEIEIACRRDGTILGLRGQPMPTSAPISAPTARSAPRNIAQFLSGPYRVPNIDIEVVALRHQQDAGRHLSRPGPLRGRFLPRAADRHGGARSRHRPGRVPPPQSRHRSRDALRDRAGHAVRRRDRVRQRRLSPARSTAASRRSAGPKSSRCRAS